MYGIPTYYIINYKQRACREVYVSKHSISLFLITATVKENKHTARSETGPEMEAGVCSCQQFSGSSFFPLCNCRGQYFQKAIFPLPVPPAKIPNVTQKQFQINPILKDKVNLNVKNKKILASTQLKHIK